MTKKYSAFVAMLVALAMITAGCGGSSSSPSSPSAGGGTMPATPPSLTFTSYTAKVNQRGVSLNSVMIEATVNGPAGTMAKLEVTGLGNGCSAGPGALGGLEGNLKCNVWVPPGEYLVNVRVPGATPTDSQSGYVDAR